MGPTFPLARSVTTVLIWLMGTENCTVDDVVMPIELMPTTSPEETNNRGTRKLVFRMEGWRRGNGSEGVWEGVYGMRMREGGWMAF